MQYRTDKFIHGCFNQAATVDEWQLGLEALDAQVSFDRILNWFKQNTARNDLSNTEYVQTIYTQTLGRDAAEAELNQQLARLDSNEVSHEWLAYEIAESSEAAIHLVGSVMLQEGWV